MADSIDNITTKRQELAKEAFAEARDSARTYVETRNEFKATVKGSAFPSSPTYDVGKQKVMELAQERFMGSLETLENLGANPESVNADMLSGKNNLGYEHPEKSYAMLLINKAKIEIDADKKSDWLGNQPYGHKLKIKVKEQALDEVENKILNEIAESAKSGHTLSQTRPEGKDDTALAASDKTSAVDLSSEGIAAAVEKGAIASAEKAGQRLTGIEGVQVQTVQSGAQVSRTLAV